MSYSGATPDKVYFDITITNLQTITEEPPILYFNQSRSSPFVNVPEDYFLSIVRFTLDTPTLPILQVEIVPQQGNVDLTVYNISLQWTNPIAPFQTFTQTTPLIFLPQNTSATVPFPPSLTINGLQNNATGYYDIYSYQYFIYLVNRTFTQCFTALNAQVVGAGLVLPSTFEPTLTYDTTNYIGILNVDVLGYDTQSPNYIKIFFNPALYQLFSSFPSYISNLTINNSLNLQIITNTFGGSNIAPFPSTAPLYNAISVYQEYSTVGLWTPITSIVFCSNTLPIVPNQISSPLLFIDGRILTSSNNSNIAQVITDFVSDTGLYKPNIVYNPTAQYRLVDLQGNRPLTNIDLTVFWKDRVGVLQPFRLSSGSSATVKILFTKKTSVSNFKNLYN